MPYAQLSYKQTVGSSQLTIQEIGCFLTANANVLEKVSITVDPPTLNTFYESHNLYTYDLTDKANDDITWSTVTHYCPQLVVNQVGSAGFPNLDLAIVEFRYKDTHGDTVTHFCAVNSAADHSIIDSWDGKVKTPAEYEYVYGQPIAWATYVYHTPATIPASLPPSAPISAPHAVTASVSVPAPAAPHTLYLPPSVSVWHVYNPGGPWTLPHATHVLDPKMFGGLTYQILGNPAPNIYLIQTQMFGEVAIYAGPDTVAQFPGIGHGEGESTDATPPAAGIPVSEVVPAPAPVVPEATPTGPTITYAKFDGPMDLVTKDGAQLVNFVSGTVVETLSVGTPFTAVGKATLMNNDTYYMNEINFGTADQTQTTPITVGIKTVYLTEAPKAEASPTVPQTPPASPVLPALQNSTPAPDTSAEGNTVKPFDFTPTLPWQGSFELFPNKEEITYVVLETMKVYSFVTGNDITVVNQGTPIVMVGTFIYGGRRMYLPKSSAPKDLGGKDTWYGFPVASVKRQSASNTLFNTNDDINQLGLEAEQEISKAKHVAIKSTATAHGLWSRLKTKRS